MFLCHTAPRNISNLTFVGPKPRNVYELMFLDQPRNISELMLLGQPRNINYVHR
jgi:hypothetical protein